MTYICVVLRQRVNIPVPHRKPSISDSFKYKTITFQTQLLLVIWSVTRNRITLLKFHLLLYVIYPAL
jgi:hypothetical protein